MEIPLQINFRHMEPSDALEAKIRQKVQKIEQLSEHITSFRVTIDQQHKHHHQGKLFSVKIDFTVPGNEIIVDRHPDNHHAHEDAYVALADAFDACRRRLKDYLKRRRGKVKAHETMPRGRISKLSPYQDYGLIETLDGREIYFHRNSVVDEDFDKLTEGDNVRFSEEMGEKGPQGSTVHLAGKHH